MIRVTIIALLSVLFLSGCSSISELQIFKSEVKRTPLNLALPDTPKMEELQWLVVTSKNSEELFAKMEKEGKDPAVFGLSDDDFQLLAKNFAHIRAYMIQQQAIIQQYKDYYEPVEELKSE